MSWVHIILFVKYLLALSVFILFIVHHQSTVPSSFIIALIWESHIGLILIVNGLFGNFRAKPVQINIGRWSDRSHVIIPEIKFSMSLDFI